MTKRRRRQGIRHEPISIKYCLRGFMVHNGRPVEATTTPLFSSSECNRAARGLILQPPIRFSVLACSTERKKYERKKYENVNSQLEALERTIGLLS